MTMYVLMVTWFYFNQSPVNYQTEFASAELCEGARVDLLHEEIRLRQESEERSKQDQARGIVRGSITTPTVSAICAKK
jgi:hypothetical protein